MLYELSNPHDKYTLESENEIDAALVSACLNFRYALHSVDGKDSILILNGSNYVEWFNANGFIVNNMSDIKALIVSHSEEIAIVLDSLVLEDRNKFFNGLNKTTEKRAFILEWDDTHKQPVTDIWFHATSIASRLRNDPQKYVNRLRGLFLNT